MSAFNQYIRRTKSEMQKLIQIVENKRNRKQFQVFPKGHWWTCTCLDLEKLFFWVSSTICIKCHQKASTQTFDRLYCHARKMVIQDELQTWCTMTVAFYHLTRRNAASEQLQLADLLRALCILRMWSLCSAPNWGHSLQVQAKLWTRHIMTVAVITACIRPTHRPSKLV